MIEFTVWYDVIIQRDKSGNLIPLSVKEGDKVLLPEYGGQQVKLDKDEYTLVREADLLAIIQ